MTFKPGDKIQVIPYDKLLNVLESSGYRQCYFGNWRKQGDIAFANAMVELATSGGVMTVIAITARGSIETDDHLFRPEWVQHAE